MPTYNETCTEEIQALLVGRKVTKIDESTLLLDDGSVLQLEGNDGCGGCASGWYELTELNECDNIITQVELVSELGNYSENVDQVYSIFVYADARKINLARFEGTDGNEYYGTGFTIHVTLPH